MQSRRSTAGSWSDETAKQAELGLRPLAVSVGRLGGRWVAPDRAPGRPRFARPWARRFAAERELTHRTSRLPASVCEQRSRGPAARVRPCPVNVPPVRPRARRPPAAAGLNATAHNAHARIMGESDLMLDTHAVARSLDTALVERALALAGTAARAANEARGLPMRLALVVVALVLVALLGAPASAQIQDDLGGRRAAVCAADVLDYLTESQPPYTPTFHVGLATWFMGCTYFLPPSVGPILSTMRADIETIHRHRAEGEDVSGRHRTVVCRTWWAIYSSTYNGLIPEYGSGVVGDLPTPEAYWDACERWLGAGATGAAFR